MKVACALIPNFETAVELCRRPDLVGRPVVVGGLPHERKSVRSLSPEAAACGVAVGMSLRQARGLCPEAVFLPPDDDLYRGTFHLVLGVLEGFSPTIEVDGATLDKLPPAIYLDASGLERLFGPDGELGRQIAAAVEGETGLGPRVGLGSSKFVARVAALRAAPGSALVVAKGRERSFLAPQPVELLPCSTETLRRLGLLGLRTLGQLAGLPAGALAEPFGQEGVEVYRLARGIDDRPLIPREVPLLLEEGVEIDPPTDQLDLILSVTSALAERLAARMRSNFLACREVALRVGFSDGSAVPLSTTLHEPTDGEGDLRRAVERLLANVAAGRNPRVSGGETVSSLRLTLSGFGGRQGEQLELFPSRADGLRRVRRAVREAEAQFGEGAIRPLAEMARERRAASPLRVAVDEGGRPRYLSLGGRRERVMELCNRWRVRGDWWRQELYRDYYRLITESGRLCVVYRDLTPQPPSRNGKGAHTPLPVPWFLERIYG